MDGEITSSVNGDQIPYTNNQSNFGAGFGYQYGAEKGTVEVYLNDSWRIFATEQVREQIQFPENPKQPPALTVVCCDNGVEALSGTASWAYLHEDGVVRRIEFDSLHPLQAKEHMPILPLLPNTATTSDMRKAYLQWGITPDSISVRCWSEECWGQADAKSENVTLAGSEEFVILLKDGNNIYEVIAEWNFPETRGGRACFSFRTEKTEAVRCIN